MSIGFLPPHLSLFDLTRGCQESVGTDQLINPMQMEARIWRKKSEATEQSRRPGSWEELFTSEQIPLKKSAVPPSVA